MKKSINIAATRKPTVRALVLALSGIGLASLPLTEVVANPQSGQVVAGSAAIRQETPNKIGITQTTDKAIIDWRSFSIGANEQVQFYQPAASSVTLNRVVGQDPSQILGRLTANGQVFLVNPNGIYFGKNAQIDVAGLVASTHNIRNEDFMAGKYSFNIPGKPGAAVINEGTINIADTGIAAFVAPSVANRGVIVAKLGKVALASANGFTLDFTGDQLLTFLVGNEVAKTAFDIEGKQLTSFVENSGKIEAQGGYVLLTAKAAENAIHSVINQNGSIEATSVGQQNGEIVLSGGLHGLVSNTGTLDASGKDVGETGGRVVITGETLELSQGARIDVSGDSAGGAALIGGDHMGGHVPPQIQQQYGLTLEHSSVQNATTVRIGADVVIDVSAINNGDGGKIVVWANDSTAFHGTALARGGEYSGNGGVVEISGGRRVVSDGFVDVSAKAGKSGHYLIDPAGFIYASTADFIAAFDNRSMSIIGFVERAMNYYILSRKIISNSDYRTDPDGIRTYRTSIIVTKIKAGEIVAQAEIDQIYAGSPSSPSTSLVRGTITGQYLGVDNGKIQVFFSEKDAGTGYGQTGYAYSIDQNTLVSSRSVIFNNANWGWFPYYDQIGNLWHFSFAGYYEYKNTTLQYSIQPTDAAKAGQSQKLIAAGESGNLSQEIPWDTLTSSLLSGLKGKVGSTAPQVPVLTTAQQTLLDKYSRTTGDTLFNGIVSGELNPVSSDLVWAALVQQNLSGSNKAAYMAGIYNTYKNTPASNLFNGILKGDLNNAASDSVWKALVTNNLSGTNTATQMSAIYSLYQSATSSKVLEGLTNGDIVYGGAIWIALGNSNQQQRDAAYSTYTHPAPVSNLTVAQQALVDAHKNDSTFQMLRAIADGLFTNSNTDPVWLALYQNGAATAVQVAADTQRKIYDAYTPTDIFSLIRSGQLKNDSTDATWHSIYRNGSATAAQITANRFTITYDTYKSATANTLFNGIVSGDISPNSAASNAVVWQALVRQNLTETNKAAQMADTYNTYKKVDIPTLVSGLNNHDFVYGDAIWIALATNPNRDNAYSSFTQATTNSCATAPVTCQGIPKNGTQSPSSSNDSGGVVFTNTHTNQPNATPASTETSGSATGSTTINTSGNNSGGGSNEHINYIDATIGVLKSDSSSVLLQELTLLDSDLNITFKGFKNALSIGEANKELDSLKKMLTDANLDTTEIDEIKFAIKSEGGSIGGLTKALNGQMAKVSSLLGKVGKAAGYFAIAVDEANMVNKIYKGEVDSADIESFSHNLTFTLPSGFASAAALVTLTGSLAQMAAGTSMTDSLRTIATNADSIAKSVMDTVSLAYTVGQNGKMTREEYQNQVISLMNNNSTNVNILSNIVIEHTSGLNGWTDSFTAALYGDDVKLNEVMRTVNSATNEIAKISMNDYMLLFDSGRKSFENAQKLQTIVGSTP